LRRGLNREQGTGNRNHSTVAKVQTNSAPALRPPHCIRILLLILVNALLFSVLGGALLTRYLLPLYPLVLLLAVTTFYRRVRYWHGLAVLSAAAFVAGLFINPPYGFAPEDNLAYAHVIRLHQGGIAQLEKRCPGATVLSAWPASDELKRPELGYLNQPFSVYRHRRLLGRADRPRRPGAGAILRRAGLQHQVRSVFAALSRWGRRAKPWTNATSACTTTCAPEEIALELHGELLWKQEDQGQWIAVIRFNRQFDARLDLSGSLPNKATALLGERPCL
jgi:hypothetical protein